MIQTLRLNFRDPDRRRYVGAKMGGKLIGVALVMGVIYGLAWFFSNEAGAAVPGQAAAVKVTEVVNGLNTAWVLVTAFLVFFMQAGFMMLEGGFARTREVSNIMIECIVDTALCGLLFYAFGFAFMFGPGNGWIGYHYFFLQDIPHTYTYGGSLDTGVAFLAFFLFQFAFADTASTIVSGAMVGRTSFKGDLLYSLAVSGFIYPIFGHWIWGPNGWLATMETPFRDFAGSTVVHTIGGVLALCGAIALGPRLGRKFKRDGGGMPPGHNMTLAALGAVILWFGWYGFNPGSTLSAMDFEGIGRVATNTTLAACAGALVAVAWVYPRSKKWDVGISINGLLAGLVAITCPCYWVSPTGSIAIGAIAGVIMILIVDFTEWVRVDDPCGAFAVHGACGIFGTLSLGLFAVGNYSDVKGILYGGNANQLIAQVKGSATIIAATAAAGLLLMFGLKALGVLRISEAEELEGLDIAEHGAPAYHPEYAYMGYSQLPPSIEESGGGVGVVAPPSDIHLPATE
ncbi:MAG TPA: ammonium transporter [Acidimicrobiia bacterium]|jgi:ammonium transporter, Amt family|nr:ammonium transporter [Acidimicrobiia bacterium]